MQSHIAAPHPGLTPRSAPPTLAPPPETDPGDEFKIVADSFAYARYISYQTYELRTLMSRESLRDVDIVPDHGPNLYNNLTAAVLGEKQGERSSSSSSPLLCVLDLCVHISLYRMWRLRL